MQQYSLSCLLYLKVFFYFTQNALPSGKINAITNSLNKNIPEILLKNHHSTQSVISFLLFFSIDSVLMNPS